MSVHGEYSRSLEALIACLRAVDRPGSEEWAEQLEGARVEARPDLSSAARVALGVALTVEQGLAEQSPPAAKAGAHLVAHCRLILGSDPL